MAGGIDDFKFKEGLERLEKLVGELERGELDLEDALERYEEGLKLYRRLLEVLEKAEKRIEILSGEKKGKLLWKKFSAPGPATDDDPEDGGQGAS